MVRVAWEELDPQLIQDAEKLYSLQQMETIDYKNGAYFTEQRMQRRFGRTTIMLVTGATGGGEAEESYCSELELFYNRKGKLTSMRGHDFLDNYKAYDSMLMITVSAGAKLYDCFSWKSAKEQQQNIISKANRFIPIALSTHL